MKESRARSKLEQARFFTACASRSINGGQWEAFVNFVEAAIVFGRSVTFLLQKEYRHGVPNFDNWYLLKQADMEADPLCQFFLGRRNYILKEGSAGIHKASSIDIEDHVSSSDFLEIKVVRGQAWYRRSPAILWEDVRAAIMKPVRRWLYRRGIRQQNLRVQRHSKVPEVVTEVFFDDPLWKDRSVCDLLHEYLNKMDQVVTEAERQFSNKR